MKIVKNGQRLAAAVCLAAVLAGCSTGAGNGAVAKPSNPSSPSDSFVSSSSSSNSTVSSSQTSSSKPDYSSYPISDPSTWIFRTGTTYGYKLYPDGTVDLTCTYASRYIPKDPGEDLLLLDGVPFELVMGGKFAWDGENLRCLKAPTLKIIPPTKWNYRAGYKYVAVLGSTDNIDRGEWIKEEEVGKYTGLGNENIRVTTNWLILDGFPIEKGYNKYFWHNGQLYYRG